MGAGAVQRRRARMSGARRPRGKVVPRESTHRFVYSRPMTIAAESSRPRGLALLLNWRRLRFTLGISLLFGIFLGLLSETAMIVVISRALLVGAAVMLAFGVFEQWPRQLPGWLARSALQLIGVAAVIPFAALLAYWVTIGGNPHFSQDEQRLMGYWMLTVTGLLFAPWIAVGAMFKQRDKFARDQAMAFELERSQLERNALDARLRLLQAQVAPHFLFNTLANVQALVESGSPQASQVLSNLIAYLRAAVPRINDRATTLGQELQLARAYLELMQMRMPDRLQFALRIEPAAIKLLCPPMTLLTLVENAVRHGIDPSEQGGRIDVDGWIRDGRCHVRVTDSGIGLRQTSDGLGTGLSTLRERLQLTFGSETRLQVTEVQPHGVCVELEFPARQEHA